SRARAGFNQRDAWTKICMCGVELHVNLLKFSCMSKHRPEHIHCKDCKVVIERRFRKEDSCPAIVRLLLTANRRPGICGGLKGGLAILSLDQCIGKRMACFREEGKRLRVPPGI